MLLNELNTNPLASYKQSSALLENLFGVKVEFTGDLNKLREGEEKATAIIENLKYQNKAIDNREVSKYTLINETLSYLIEHENKQRLDELKHGYTSSSNYRTIVDGLVDYVDELMNIGDDFDEAVKDAMKKYRSCKHRYSDVEIESDIRREVLIRNGEELPSHTQVTSLYDSVDESIEEGDFQNPGQDHGSVSKGQRKAAGKYLSKGSEKLTVDGQEESPYVVNFDKTKQTKLSPAQRANLMRNMQNNESVVESAIAQMQAIVEGTLVEGEATFEDEQLDEVALVISEAPFYDANKQGREVAQKYLDFKGSNLSIDDGKPKVDYGKGKTPDTAMNKAKIAAIKARAAKPVNEAGETYPEAAQAMYDMISQLKAGPSFAGTDIEDFTVIADALASGDTDAVRNKIQNMYDDPGNHAVRTISTVLGREKTEQIVQLNGS